MASKMGYDQYQRKKRIKINYFHEYIQKLKARKKKGMQKKSSNGNTVCGMPSNGTFVCRHDKKNLQTQIDGRKCTLTNGSRQTVNARCT